MAKLALLAVFTSPTALALVRDRQVPSLAQRDTEDIARVSYAKQNVERADKWYRSVEAEEKLNSKQQGEMMEQYFGDVDFFNEQVENRLLWQKNTEVARTALEKFRKEYSSLTLNAVRAAVGKAETAFHEAVAEEELSIKQQDVMYERHLDTNDTDWYVEQGQYREQWADKTAKAKKAYATALAQQTALLDVTLKAGSLAMALDDAKQEEEQALQDQEFMFERYHGDEDWYTEQFENRAKWHQKTEQAKAALEDARQAELAMIRVIERG